MNAVLNEARLICQSAMREYARDLLFSVTSRLPHVIVQDARDKYIFNLMDLNQHLLAQVRLGCMSSVLKFILVLPCGSFYAYDLNAGGAQLLGDDIRTGFRNVR